jgi:hypothetical protein
MAYSKITIDFVAVQQGTILSFTETNLNISFVRLSKKQAWFSAKLSQ